MSQDEQYPERGYNTEDVEAIRTSAPPPKKSVLRRHWGKLLLGGALVVPILGFTLWTVIAMAYTYSSGDRVGYVQKLSQKGWICKTYEGEIAMVNLPGQIANTFQFTVRSDSIAAVINKLQGQQVALEYKQHKGVPTSCFGETEYFVSGVRAVAR